MCFNSRPHEEVDVQFGLAQNLLLTFQLTTSRRGRQRTKERIFWFLMFQLTTSRRGRRYADKVYEGDYFVSTHDLTKRSTDILGSSLISIFVSTHDLTKRSTAFLPLLLVLLACFNSRPHEEVDAIPDRDSPRTLEFQLTTSRRGRPQPEPQPS